MERNKHSLITPAVLFAVFVLYTAAVALIDVKPVGQMNSNVGMATINKALSDAIGVHMIWYDITNILGILALLIAAFFGVVGVIQLVTRKSLLKVDRDIIILGCFYVMVIVCYVLFDHFAINYRPVMLEDTLEASYPSSHTMLAVCVMSTAICQLKWKMRDEHVSRIVQGVLAVLIVLTVVGRMISGVHWFTDIIGGVLLSAFLVSLYVWFVYEAGGPGRSRNTGNEKIRRQRSAKRQ
ncbi:MAG: phosphatase PAP2 family protein [Clostridiales bacterium]|nr:phosphatase PAP2 family protein [Clostridiales bacterium]MDD6540313.1 phosphatase PAP2 family protein [Bacillota bacterium]MDD7015436.1 phosphatase PAP2 family protein [Bacillota bacterium]MDY4959712.1 phosphatase PAP2 family protein [Lentihominibacter sp.]